MTKRKILVRALLVLGVLALSLPTVALAFETRSGDSVYIGPAEIVDGSLYVAGANLTIDGRVKGDVIAAGQSITVNGQVDGDVIAVGQSLTVNGKVAGNIRVAGNAVNINSEVGRNLNAFGAAVNLGTTARIGSDALIAAGTADIRGSIGRDLHGAAGSANITGQIGRDVDLILDEMNKRTEDGRRSQDVPKLNIGSTAKIGGRLEYRAQADAKIDEGAKIASGTERQEPKPLERKKGSGSGWLWWRIWSLFSALVVGLVLVSLFRKRIMAATDIMLQETWTTIGWGAVILFAGPLMLLALVLTLIGLPLAFILLALWLVALYLGKIITGIMIGRSLVDKFAAKGSESLIWPMIIGLAAAWLIFAIPFIGPALSLFATVWGIGAIWLVLKKHN